jgi:tRNA-modifying protein YgfZ
MPTAFLPERGVVRVSGADARSWLNNLVTCDLAGLAEGEARFGALLSPQGKILFDFIASTGSADLHGGPNEAIHLDTARSLAPDFAKRLAFYRLRAKVEIVDLTQGGEPGERVGVAIAWGEMRSYQGDAVRFSDPRHPDLGERMLTLEQHALAIATAGVIDFQEHRIALAIPEGGHDFAYGETFPHEALMDMLGGLDFRKGCYVGQEVVSRMAHRGTARTRIVPVRFVGEGPPIGAEVRVGEKVLGRMGSSVAGRGLAMLRLDRVQEAAGLPIRADGIELTLVRPSWWSADWPGVANGDDKI